jgi:hypothetical protein
MPRSFAIKVWEMVFCGQKALTQGYSSMIMTAGEFQYVYRVWFVDENHVELPIADMPLSRGLKSGSRIRLCNSFYKDLAKRMYGNNRRVRVCSQSINQTRTTNTTTRQCTLQTNTPHWLTSSGVLDWWVVFAVVL